MRKFIFIFFLFFFMLASAKEVKTVKVINIPISIKRAVYFSPEESISGKEEKRIQEIQTEVPVLKFNKNYKILKKVQQQIIEMLVPEVGEKNLLEFRGKYEIGINNNRIFSIKLYSYEYYRGAAHGNSDMVAFNIDLKCKKFIKFFDIFDEKKHIYDEKTKTYKEIYPLEEIKKILKEKIKKEYDCEVFEEEFSRCSYIPEIFLKRESIEFIFPKYEVTPGACDSFSVAIPYEELKIYFREDINLELPPKNK